MEMIDQMVGLGSFLLDVFYPPLCVGCRKLGGYLCPDCLDTIRVYRTPLCPGCMKPIAQYSVHHGCRTATALDGLCAVAHHDGVIRQMISMMKYEGISDVISTVGGMITKTCGLELQKGTLLTCVPTHTSRLRERGYNQSAEIAKDVSKRTGMHYQELLIKTHATIPQARSSKSERLTHVQGVFSPRDTMIHSERVIIVDDVVTTGATLNECAHVLRKMGATKVYGVTLAHGK